MTDQSSRCSIRTFYDLTGFILNLYATKKVHLGNPAHLFTDVCYDFFLFLLLHLTVSKKENSVCCVLQGLVIELFREPHLLEE